MENIQNWNNFIVEFKNEILPIYEKHENTFDYYKIHGKLHIARSIFFAEFMGRFFIKELNKNIDLTAIRYAISFHDSGRQDNGIDLWEKDSEKNCYNYLMNKNFNEKYYKYIADLINKNKSSDINKNIVYDADVIEIMRPCCGHGGLYGFNENYLNFLKNDKKYADIRRTFITDSWKLIVYTEDIKDNFTNNHLYKIIDIVKNNKEYKLFNKFLF